MAKIFVRRHNDGKRFESRILDLSSKEYKLLDSSGTAEALIIEPEHRPLLQNYVVGGTVQFPKDHSGYYRRYEDHDETPTELVRFHRFQGQFVLDLPVPPRLYSAVVPIHDGLQQRFQTATRNEFSHVRYAPVTCDPNDFVASGYTLRQPLFAIPRYIEICVCITMYNEDEWLLGSTLQALHENIRSLQHSGYEHPWGPDSWQKIVVCIISDGRAKIDPRTRAMLASLGVYQDFGFQQLDGRDTVAHLFEYTTNATIEIEPKYGSVQVEPGSPDSVPCQTILCLKEKNQKKINSHRWFLNAICRVIRPRTCVFLDAGVVPASDALYRLWKPFNDDPTIASTVGSCTALVRPRQWINPVLGYQALEYGLTNSLERPVESVLRRRFAINKGGFTAYHYHAILGNALGDGITGQGDGIFGNYFQVEKLLGTKDIFKANAFLTEDRSLASALLKPDQTIWKTVSVDGAQVETDVPMVLTDFLLQRRRWIDGDFFSTLYDLLNAPRYLFQSRTVFRGLGLLFGYVYQVVLLVLQFFSIGNCFTIFSVIATSLGDDAYRGSQGRNAAMAMTFIYLFLFVSTIIFCLGNPVRVGFGAMYAWLCFFWCVLFSYLFGMVLYLVIKSSSIILASIPEDQTSKMSILLKGQLFLFLVWPLLLILLIWLISPLTLMRKPHTFSSIFWYIFLSPAYTNLVGVYAFCNVHDVVWGTVKGNDKAETLPPPSVNARGNYNFDGNGGVGISQDAGGNLIVHGFQDYLDNLDSFIDQQSQIYTQQREKDRFIPSTFDEADLYMRHFRTLMLLLWLGLNGALAMTVMNVPSISHFVPTPDGGKGFVYVGVVLWAYAGVTVFQYTCTVLYALSLLWNKIWRLIASRKSQKNTQNEPEEFGLETVHIISPTDK